MSEYRRNYVPGGTYFFTCVTFLRSPFLVSDLARHCLHEAIADIRDRHPFDVVAIVLMPDHWHTVWTLPPGDDEYPMRWRRIKEAFTKQWISGGGQELEQSASRKRRRQRGVWQRRYWEHTVRDEGDLERCVDYIHWNPRKHKLVQRVRDWPYSSFHRFVKDGHYDIEWGGTDPSPGWDCPE
ncbi:MAG: REP-associated tyrosine transposase [Pirellulaceae bacterium]